MGYNKCRNYLSPKQIGYIHSRYSNAVELIRTTKNNFLNNEKDVFIYDDTIWNKSILISGDIIIKKGATLHLKNIISVADGSCIYMEKNTKLIVDGGIIRNINNNWNGLVFCKSVYKPHKKPFFKKNLGELELKNNGEIIW